MENLKVVKVSADDVITLQKIGRETFTATFANVNTPEDMDQYLNNSFSLAQLTEEINHPHSLFYFAIINGDVAGYLKVNAGNAQTELKENNGLEIERIYVQQSYHGKKVGQVLYQKALEIAAGKGAAYVWLGVWEENARAINFYTKNGFVPFDKHIFKLGSDEQTDIMMKKTLE